MNTTRLLSCLLIFGSGSLGSSVLAQEVVEPKPTPPSLVAPTPEPVVPLLVEEATPPPPEALPPVAQVPVLFDSDPPGATVSLDGRYVCHAPCRVPVEPGLHHVSMNLDGYNAQREQVSLDADSAVSFTLEEKPYNYFAMNDLSGFGSLLVTGIDPTNTQYRFFSVVDGAHFFELSSVVDLGMGGGVFSYHHGPRGSAWSIFAFGPSLRLGRFIATSHVELLSFRHDAPQKELEGWRPGLTSKLQLPLLSSREVGGWSALMPVPTIGVDVWLDDELRHDETAFWIGLSWIPGTSF